MSPLQSIRRPQDVILFLPVVTIAVTTGEDDKIHGTVTNVQIADALMEKGIEIDR